MVRDDTSGAFSTAAAGEKVAEGRMRGESSGVPSPDASFSIVTRDEIRGRSLRESRLIHGSAQQRELEIRATDDCDAELLRLCDAAVQGWTRAETRIIASARRVRDVVRVTVWINATRGNLSIISTPENFDRDVALLQWKAGAVASPDYHNVPILWRNGSASVLLHEAIGHAAEHRKPPLVWPAWLSVVDDPPFDIDDVGARSMKADLLRGEPPRSLLRESFTDVPLARMSRLVARQTGVSLAAPERRIEIHLVAGGSYDPLTDTVSITASAADLIEGTRSVRLEPFTIIETRDVVARALRSAAGEPIRYPGVVCSREGQELVVESFAPEMLTVFDV